MESCHLDRKCIEAHIIYKPQVSTEGKCAFYGGTADSRFKLRYNNHVLKCPSRLNAKRKILNSRSTFGTYIKKILGLI